VIDYLRDKVAYAESEYVVLDVHDVGYQVFTPNPYGLLRTDEPVQLFTYHHVREDAMQLFGFTTRDEQALFQRLLEVSGIGPKVALGVLAGGRPENVVAAIQQENLAFLTKLPGIGKKTAQRMILDLKDKLGTIDSRWAVASMIDLHQPQNQPEEGGSSWAAAREALAGLGYREAEMDKAWLSMKDRITGEESPDTLIKLALQQLFQG